MAERHRSASPTGWQMRRKGGPFADAHEALLQRRGTDEQQVQARYPDHDRLQACFAGVAKDLSSPYFEPMITALKGIFQRFQHQGAIVFPYETVICHGQLG